MKYKIDLDEARQIEQLEIKIEWLQNANTNFVRRICDQTREIERPRAIIDTPSEEPEWVVDFKKLNRFAGVGYSLIDIEIAKKWHTAYRKAQNSNLLRKQEIERMREEMENYGDDYVCQMKSKDSRIQELEDALVEERARCIELGRAASTGRFKPVPPLQESKELARRQLQRDGKIGPDADAKPQVWQITEERKAALWHAIKVLKENDIMEEPEEHLWDEEVTVLQAMLAEAE